MKEAFFITLWERRKNLGVLIILVLTLHGTAYSQFSFYKNYTSNDGLPSSKVYDIRIVWILCNTGNSHIGKKVIYCSPGCPAVGGFSIFWNSVVTGDASGI